MIYPPSPDVGPQPIDITQVQVVPLFEGHAIGEPWTVTPMKTWLIPGGYALTIQPFQFPADCLDGDAIDGVAFLDRTGIELTRVNLDEGEVRFRPTYNGVTLDFSEPALRVITKPEEIAAT